jgi:hypothetical protein
VNLQVPPLHSVLAAPSGLEQGVHEVPQELALALEEQTPPQSWEPAGQTSQVAVASTQAPLQIFCVPGQVPLHTPSLQIAVPPVIVGHGVHRVPQLANSVSLRHFFASPFE